MYLRRSLNKKYYVETQEEPFCGEDMLPFVALLYNNITTENITPPEVDSNKAERRIASKKVKIYFWQNIVKKVFKF